MPKILTVIATLSAIYFYVRGEKREEELIAWEKRVEDEYNEAIQGWSQENQDLRMQVKWRTQERDQLISWSEKIEKENNKTIKQLEKEIYEAKSKSIDEIVTLVKTIVETKGGIIQ
jgi:hypothetical protein